MKRGIRVIVCGGRDYTNNGHVFKNLDKLHAETPFGDLWHGNARGADTIAGSWARNRGVTERATPAEWSRYGKQAGPRRNQAMLGQGADLVVAFPSGAGTADMVRRAEKAGVKVLRIPSPIPRAGG